jgi:cysteine synthase A
MAAQGKAGSVVSVICDGGERYASTYYDRDWLRDAKIYIEPQVKMLNAFLETGEFHLPS